MRTGCSSHVGYPEGYGFVDSLGIVLRLQSRREVEVERGAVRLSDLQRCESIPCFTTWLVVTTNSTISSVGFDLGGPQMMAELTVIRDGSLETCGMKKELDGTCGTGPGVI